MSWFALTDFIVDALGSSLLPRSILFHTNVRRNETLNQPSLIKQVFFMVSPEDCWRNSLQFHSNRSG